MRYPTSYTQDSLDSIINSYLTTTDSSVTTTQKAQWSEAYTNMHTHSNKGYLDAVSATILTTSDRAVAGGVASLNSLGVVPTSQLSDTITSGLKWQSVIDVTTATIDDASSSNSGYFYKNTTAGTSSITGTSLTWSVGDWLISNGSAWERVPATESSATTESLGQIMLANDLGGTASAPVVTGIQGVTVDATDIADGFCLAYDSDSKTIVYKVLSTAAYGDTKESYQTADHDGWVLADGRAITDLTDSQQIVATNTLGFSSTIPNLQNVFILGAGDDYDLAASGGSFTIAIANLPKTNIASSKTVTVKPYGTVSTTTTSTASSSCSSTYPFGSSWYAVTTYGSQTMYSDEGSAISGTGNAYIQLASDISDSYIASNRAYHSHTVSTSVSSSSTSTFTGTSTSYSLPTIYVNGGVTQTEYKQPYIALNRFIYLGA